MDSTSVYWTTTYAQTGMGRVMKVGIDGGSPVTLASGQEGAGDIAVDSASVYWTGNHTLTEVGIDGGSPVTLASGQAWTMGVAVDSTNVYWTAAPLTPQGAMMKVGINGGSPVTLASGQYTPEQSAPGGIAVDSANVYWTNNLTTDANTVMKVGTDGGAPVTLATLQNSLAGGVALDSTSVYWTIKAPLKGTPASIYKDGAVMKVGLDGGSPVTLASGQKQPVGIAVDSTSVYWTNESAATVMKLTPK